MSEAKLLKREIETLIIKSLEEEGDKWSLKERWAKNEPEEYVSPYYDDYIRYSYCGFFKDVKVYQDNRLIYHFEPSFRSKIKILKLINKIIEAKEREYYSNLRKILGL